MADPITPPPELFQQLADLPRSVAFEAAYRAGADQELEACCEWLDDTDCDDPQEVAQLLRAARRPKPSSLKEQALEQLRFLQQCGAGHRDTDKILRALEQLTD